MTHQIVRKLTNLSGMHRDIFNLQKASSGTLLKWIGELPKWKFTRPSAPATCFSSSTYTLSTCFSKPTKNLGCLLKRPYLTLLHDVIILAVIDQEHHINQIHSQINIQNIFNLCPVTLNIDPSFFPISTAPFPKAWITLKVPNH